MKKLIKRNKAIEEMCLMDDIFFNVCMDGQVDCVQLILRIILEKPKLKVLKVETQRTIANLGYHGVRLDVLASAEGKIMDIEVQRSDTGAIPKRARYNSSLINAKVLEQGKEYKDLPESYVIFITEHDVLQAGKPIYHIERIIRETGKQFADGEQIIYVNGENRDDSPLGKLMQDFFCSVPEQMNYAELANRTKEIKEKETGVSAMSELSQTFYEQGKIDMIIEMLKNNQPIALISKVSNFTIEKIKEIAKVNNIPVSQ